MNHLFKLVCVTSIVFSSITFGALIPEVQCWAYGNQLRSYGSEVNENLVNSRLVFSLGYNAVMDQATIDYLGYLEVATGIQNDQTQIVNADYYALFDDKDLVSSKSPRAIKYFDTEYLRFKEFNANATTSKDGGGMWGYLVLSRQAVVKGAHFTAHYVFQAGDHMGGTVDYQCFRRKY